jgi:hypothetical protein
MAQLNNVFQNSYFLIYLSLFLLERKGSALTLLPYFNPLKLKLVQIIMFKHSVLTSKTITKHGKTSVATVVPATLF